MPPLPFTDRTTRLDLTVSVNQDEYTQILSAIMTGADLAFPDIAHELELIWTYASEVEVVDGIALGMIVPFAGSLASIPAKYLLCNGALREISEYPELAAALADEFIEGDNFRVPHLTGRFLRGANNDADVGLMSGALSVTLTEANLPAHKHVVPAHSHSFLKAASVASQNLRVAIGSNATVADGATSTAPATDTSEVGSGTSFQILPLNQNIYYIIKALP